MREDVALLRQSPLIPDDVEISGAVYDVATGRMTVVQYLARKANLYVGISALKLAAFLC